MKELRRICSGENKFNQRHEFGTEGMYRDLTHCSICGCPLENVIVNSSVNSKATSSNRYKSHPDAIGFMRTQIIDSLPRMLWFSDIGHNDTNRENAMKVWTLKEAHRLSDSYAVFGIGDEDIWDEVAAEMGRSLYAIERQLRVIKYYPKEELHKFYPEINSGLTCLY